MQEKHLNEEIVNLAKLVKDSGVEIGKSLQNQRMNENISEEMMYFRNTYKLAKALQNFLEVGIPSNTAIDLIKTLNKVDDLKNIDTQYSLDFSIILVEYNKVDIIDLDTIIKIIDKLEFKG